MKKIALFILVYITPLLLSSRDYTSYVFDGLRIYYNRTLRKEPYGEILTLYLRDSIFTRHENVLECPQSITYGRYHQSGDTIIFEPKAYISQIGDETVCTVGERNAYFNPFKGVIQDDGFLKVTIDYRWMYQEEISGLPHDKQIEKLKEISPYGENIYQLINIEYFVPMDVVLYPRGYDTKAHNSDK